MGTNFYWRANECESCGRYADVHVGKRSAGWSFSFQAYRHDPDEGDYSPLDRSVTNRKEWAEVFAGNGSLFDEYGRHVPDPSGWLAELTPPDAEKIAWEDSPAARGPYAGDFGKPYAGGGTRDEWRDPEGFRFGTREFS